MIAGCPPLVGINRIPASACNTERPVGVAFWPGTRPVIL
jgi:hypothetical protein